MSKPADKSRLEQAHNLLAELFIEVLEKGETAVDKETGKIVKLTPNAATLNQIRQFLKDNDVKALPGGDTPMDRLGKAVEASGVTLPFEGSGAAH